MTGLYPHQVRDSVEPCFNCQTIVSETRSTYDGSFGLIYMCEACAVSQKLTGTGWDPDYCDDCGEMAAFNGPIKGFPDGFACHTCKRPNEAPWWVCIHCLVENHEGHKFESRGGISELDIILKRINGEL